jgi:hypothetical protein
MQKSKILSGVHRGIAIYDLQYPQHNQKLLANIERYMKDHPIDYLVYGGDTLDMTSLNHHEPKNYRDLEGRRAKKDYDEVSTILRRHRSLVGKDTKIYYLMGNHEEWSERFIDKYPMLEGLLEVDKNLPFKELNIEVIAPRKYAKIGKLHFIHGDVFGKYCPVFHAKKMVELYNRNVVYGDRHQYQSYIKASPVDINDKHGAWCIPASCDINPEWNRDKPNNWVNGFGVFYISGDMFEIYTVVAMSGNFISPEGKLYKL